MPTNNPLDVSIIIPAYNAAGRIRPTLEALVNQSWPRERYEIIVVDDGSGDDTAAVVAEFPVRYQRQSNQGPAAARNCGVALARGKVVLFTDDDCVPEQNWVHEMVSPMEMTNIVGVKGAYRTAQRRLWARFAQAEFVERYHMLARHRYIDMVDTHAAAFLKSVFQAMGGFDTAFPVPNNEDTDLSYRMARAGHKMVFNPAAIVWHSRHPDRLSRYMSLKFRRGYWRMVVYRRHALKMLKDAYTPQTLKLQTLLALAFTINLAVLPLAPAVMGWAAMVTAGLFGLSTVPFVVGTVPHDPLIGLLAPFFLFARGLALGTGALYYFIALPFKNHRDPRTVDTRSPDP